VPDGASWMLHDVAGICRYCRLPKYLQGMAAFAGIVDLPVGCCICRHLPCLYRQGMAGFGQVTPPYRIRLCRMSSRPSHHVPSSLPIVTIERTAGHHSHTGNVGRTDRRRASGLRRSGYGRSTYKAGVHLFFLSECWVMLRVYEVS